MTENKQKVKASGNWRKYMDYSMLSSLDFEDGQELNFKIVDVTVESVEDRLKKTQKQMVSIWLEASNGETINRPLGLNATNCKAISSIAGSSLTQKWVGVDICIYKTEIQAFGKNQSCLRIKPAVKKG